MARFEVRENQDDKELPFTVIDREMLLSNVVAKCWSGYHAYRIARLLNEDLT